MKTENAGQSQPPKVIPRKLLGKIVFLLVLLIACWSVYCQSKVELRLAALEQFIQNVADMTDQQAESFKMVSTNNRASRRALELAAEAQAAGRHEQAMIYHVSALTHDPGDAKLLKACAEFVFSVKATDAMIAQLRAVTQVVMYQIPPEDLPQALEILAKCEKATVDTVAVVEPLQDKPNTVIEEQLALVLNTPIDELVSDTTRLRERVEALETIAESLQDTPSIEKDLEGRVNATLKLAEQTLTAASIASLLDQYFKNLDATVETDTVKSLSIVQTAEAAVAQFWSLDLPMLPKSLQERINAYPIRLKKSVDKIAEVRSAPYLAEINKQAERAASSARPSGNSPRIGVSGPIQTLSTVYEDCFAQAQRAHSQIVSDAARNQAEAILVSIRDRAVKVRKEQFDAYQKWVVGRIKAAFEEHHKEWWTTNDAIKKRFHDHDVVQIDQSSLSPETARVFNDVIGKFLAGLPADQVVAVEHEMSTVEKMKVENF
jgi:hypothetical protein